MRWLRWIVTTLVLAVAIACLVLGWRWVIIHLSQETGTSSEGSRAYAYWSGFGSVFPWSLGIAAAIVATWRHKNCHARWCPLLGHPIEGTHYLACHIHHPAHPHRKRAVSLETLNEAHAKHQAHKEACEGQR